MLIVISGLPATGKTTLAAALARQVKAVQFSVDTVEDALLRSGVERGWTSGVAAYEAVGAAAVQDLVLGLTVVGGCRQRQRGRPTGMARRCCAGRS